MEIISWKPVVGYEGLYEVSDMGRVRSLHKNTKSSKVAGNIMRLHAKPKGYLGVSLSKNGKVSTKMVHRIVAIAFISNPFGKLTVNHKDADKQNNRVDNLEWATQLENVQHARALGLQPPMSPNCWAASTKAISKKVSMYSISGDYIRSFPSTHEAFRVTGISQTGISKICRNKIKNPTRYVFKYDNKH